MWCDAAFIGVCGEGFAAHTHTETSWGAVQINEGTGAVEVAQRSLTRLHYSQYRRAFLKYRTLTLLTR